MHTYCSYKSVDIIGKTNRSGIQNETVRDELEFYECLQKLEIEYSGLEKLREWIYAEYILKIQVKGKRPKG
jgi:hypothetical protein